MKEEKEKLFLIFPDVGGISEAIDKLEAFQIPKVFNI
jgi:hypothetical protein